MIKSVIRLAALLLFTMAAVSTSAELAFSPATEKAIAQFKKLDEQVGYGSYVSEGLLRASFMQDAWLTYLQEAESREDFLLGMAEIDKSIRHFRSKLSWCGEVVNFFNPGQPRFLRRQTIKVDDKEAYLNTFKAGRQLTAEERENFFDEEWSRYLDEVVVQPFELDSETVRTTVRAGALYNFALLSDGTIRVALEAPGGREYLENGEAAPGEFAYPNHTILAGSPDQPVLTAGSFLLFRSGDKELMFVSNKSGHFVPDFHSLKALKEPLQRIGVAPQTVILVPTVDLGEVVLKIYNDVQIPLTIYEEDAQRLFDLALQHWVMQLDEIDLSLLDVLSTGDLSGLTRETVAQLNRIREEATYMRSAYCLFTRAHKAPAAFHTFVKRFGRLKDAIKHQIPAVIESEARWLRKFLTERGDLLRDSTPPIASDADLRSYLTDELSKLQSLLEQPTLTLDGFHHVKKSSRQLGSLFLRLTEDGLNQGRNYFLYRSAAQNLLRINLQMATIHDEEVGKKMRGEAGEETVILAVPSGVKERLSRFLQQLRLAPQRMEIEIVPNTVFWLINAAKDWYDWHAHIGWHTWEGKRQRTNESEEPRILVQRIFRDEWHNPQEGEQLALEQLKGTLHAAKVARNALILLDATHQVEPGVDRYIECMERVLAAVANNDPYSAKVEAAQVFTYLHDRSPPTHQLEKYVCTDQESFNQLLRDYIGSLAALDSESTLTKADIDDIRNKVQAVADLLTLYLRLGKDHYTMPCAVYQEAYDDCDGVVCELAQWSPESGEPLSPKAKRMASRLLSKF